MKVLCFLEKIRIGKMEQDFWNLKFLFWWMAKGLLWNLIPLKSLHFKLFSFLYLFLSFD